MIRYCGEDAAGVATALGDLAEVYFGLVQLYIGQLEFVE